jgi:RNA 3'-phosphate cyclase
MIEIDGSYGEGGGQVLRTAVALAAYLGTPCRIHNIRRGRPKSGLRPQHEAGVQALAALCNAEVVGLNVGSKEITIKPGGVVGGILRIDVGTAGAIGLILQSLMLPAIKALSPLRLTIIGGTDVPWAPTIGYVTEVTLPVLGRVGYCGALAMTKRGYFPRGGGEVSVSLTGGILSPLQLLEQGAIRMIQGISHASEALRERRVAERQREGAMAILKKAGVPVDSVPWFRHRSLGPSTEHLPRRQCLRRPGQKGRGGRGGGSRCPPQADQLRGRPRRVDGGSDPPLPRRGKGGINDINHPDYRASEDQPLGYQSFSAAQNADKRRKKQGNRRPEINVN